jgi:ATP-binding cassette subfamily C protein
LKNIPFIIKASFALVPSSLRKRLYWLFPLMVVAALLEMVGLALIVPLVNVVAGTGAAETVPMLGRVIAWLNDAVPGHVVIVLAGAIAGFYLVKNAVLLFAVYSESKFIMSAAAATAATLLDTYLRAPYLFHLRHNSAELIRNLNTSVDDVFRSLLKSILRVFLDILIVIGTLAVLVVADPGITLTVGAGFAVFLGSFFALTHARITEWGRRLQFLHKELFRSANEFLALTREIRIFGRRAFFVRAYERLRQETSRIHVLHQSVSETPRLSIETLLVIAFVLALILVSARGQEVRDVLPLLALYAVAGFRLMPSFNRIVLYANTIRFSAPALHQVMRHRQELLGVAARVRPESSQVDIPFASDLVFENVSFRYEGMEKNTLEGVSLGIAKGQSVGLVGPSGSGKTTLVNILLGLLEPRQGRLLVDGRDILDAPAAWQRRIGFIPQDVLLLDDTLRRNIALGIEDGDIDEAAVREAVRLARLESVIAGLPQGLETVLGERGVRLSGGQRQRVGIARALYRRPEILVMDEATSALDNETEREVANALAEMHGRLTMVIIAHRLSTVRHCDTLVFLKEGRIADQGPFDELYRGNADFRRMVDLGELRPEAAARSVAAS